MKNLLLNKNLLLQYWYLIIIFIAILFIGCSKVFSKVNDGMQKINIKVEEIKELYDLTKNSYLTKKEMYLKLRKTVYGYKGETELWKKINKKNPELKQMLIEIDKSLQEIDLQLIEFDKKIKISYISWQDFKEIFQKTNNIEQKIEIFMDFLTTINTFTNYIKK